MIKQEKCRKDSEECGLVGGMNYKERLDRSGLFFHEANETER